MAGAGVRLFTAGSQLLASQVNTYLMDQVVCYFADSASRDAAFGGAGEPSLSPGRVAYLFSDNKLYLYGNDNTWAEIGAQLDNLEVTTAKINDLAVTEGKLADGAVTSTKILDGTILNIDINASAAIALTKLATGTVASVVIHNASGVPTATALSGDVTVNSSGVTAIGSGVVVNADVNASAAIDYSKLASLTAGSVVLGNSSNVATVTALSGDITVNSSGVTAIGSGVIVNADINATAAIELGKLADASIDIKTANYTLQLTDKNKFIKMNLTGTANTVTIPSDSTVAFPAGAQIHIIQYGTGKTSFSHALDNAYIYRTPGLFLRDRYSSATLLKCAEANTWMLMGDLSAT